MHAWVYAHVCVHMWYWIVHIYCACMHCIYAYICKYVCTHMCERYSFRTMSCAYVFVFVLALTASVLCTVGALRRPRQLYKAGEHKLFIWRQSQMLFMYDNGTVQLKPAKDRNCRDCKCSAFCLFHCYPSDLVCCASRIPCRIWLIIGCGYLLYCCERRCRRHKHSCRYQWYFYHHCHGHRPSSSS